MPRNKFNKVETKIMSLSTYAFFFLILILSGEIENSQLSTLRCLSSGTNAILGAVNFCCRDYRRFSSISVLCLLDARKDLHSPVVMTKKNLICFLGHKITLIGETLLQSINSHFMVDSQTPYLFKAMDSLTKNRPVWTQDKNAHVIFRVHGPSAISLI